MTPDPGPLATDLADGVMVAAVAFAIVFVLLAVVLGL